MDDRKVGVRDLVVGLAGLLVSVPVILLITIFTVGASRSCSTADEKPICAPVLQLLVGYGPFAAVAAGFVLVAAGGGWAVYRHRSPTWWVLAAYGLVGVAVLAACGLAGS